MSRASSSERQGHFQRTSFMPTKSVANYLSLWSLLSLGLAIARRLHRAVQHARAILLHELTHAANAR